PTEENINPHRIYLIILSIYLMTKDSITIDKNIKEEMQKLFADYKDKIINLEKQMGFPQNWNTETIWN
ncbi:hypothetical protein WAJ71_19455, partial [Acinetobacter baumannii]